MVNSLVRSTALRAWQCLAEGHRNGNFQSYLEMLTEDYVFFMPLGEFQGRNVGRDRAARCYKTIAGAKPQLTFLEPSLVLVQNNLAIIEWEDEGTLMDLPYRNRIVGMFEVRGEQICSYREYLGNIDLAVIGKIASPS
jgi:ketosteroid isomerase-like protein